jgi:uncharacterized membrane protein YgcG
MRFRVAAVVLGLVGLLVAVAVGLAANSIATRSFTPGADALPSAGSLAPQTIASTSGKATTAPATTRKAKKPKPVAKPKPKPTATTTATTTVDDHGGSGKGSSGKDSSGKGGGSGSSGSHGGKGSDD